MLGVFATMTTVLLKDNLIFVLKLIFACYIVTVSADRADKTKFDSNVFLSHVTRL